MKIKRLWSVFIVALMTVSLAGIALPSGRAQGASAQVGAIQEGTPPDPQNVVSFSMLGLSEQVMYGPYDSFQVRFGLPVTWKLDEGAELALMLTAFVVRESQTGLSSDSGELYTGGMIAGSLNVTYNNKLLGTLVLQSGQNVVYRLPIPADALSPVRTDGRHELVLFLDAGMDCNEEYRRTTVMVEPASAFVYPHTLVSPAIDLRNLPRPFYQRGAFQVDPAVIVLPDQPSAGELQAALTAMAAFGRMSSGKLPLSLVLDSQLPQEVRGNTNLVFVGRAASLSAATHSLRAVELPASPSDAGFIPGNAQGAPIIQADDGVLQMALSPWNPAKVLLVLGGGSDAGVIKAAQTLSSAKLQIGNQADLSVVADVRPEVLPPSVPVDRTFAELGYDIQTVTGVGSSEIFYNFYIPPGQVVTQDAYLDLVHSHSDLLNYASSGVLVALNDQAIGNVGLDENNIFQSRKRLMIPASALIPGMNTLSIQVELLALDLCSAFFGNNLWFSVFPESTLHIPLEPAQLALAALKDLSAYPYPFLSYPSLGNLAFILPSPGLSQNPLVAWQAAARVAYDLGYRANGDLFELRAAFVDQVSSDILENHDLILVGLPSELPLLAELEEDLPVPFEGGSNVADHAAGRVIYRLPEGAAVGYLELLSSKWAPRNAILAILGSTPEGLKLAAEALTTPALRNRLCGDFVALQGGQVICRDSGRRAVKAETPSQVVEEPAEQAAVEGQVLPTATPIAGLLSSEPVVSAPPARQTGWIFPAVIGLGVLVVLVVGIALATSLRKGTAQ